MVKNDLNRPITAHFIRFLPVEWNYKPCMRVEVYGTAIGKNWTHYILTVLESMFAQVLETFRYFPPSWHSYFFPWWWRSDDQAKEFPCPVFFVVILLRRVHCISCFAACPWKAKNDKCCVFPFTFKGKKYYKCIIDWVWMPWWATTSNFDKDGKWENCLPSTFYAPFSYSFQL